MLYTILIIAAIVFVLGLLLKSFLIYKKSTSITSLKYNLICDLFVVIVVLSWFFNMGWLRFIFTFLAAPFVHSIIFIIMINKAIPYIEKSIKLKRFLFISYITYILTYLLLPDGGDTGTMYMFFGLIHNDIITSISYQLARISFVANIIMLILQIREKRK